MSPEVLAAIGSGGGLVLLAVVLWGIWRLIGTLVSNIVAPLGRQLVDALQSIATELKNAAVADERRHGELKECIERSAKETRHHLNNARTPAMLDAGDDDDWDDEPTRPGGISREQRREERRRQRERGRGGE